MTIIGYVCLSVSGIAILFILIIHFVVVPRIKDKQRLEQKQWDRTMRLQTAAILSLRGEEELAQKVRRMKSIEDIADIIEEERRKRDSENSDSELQ